MKRVVTILAGVVVVAVAFAGVIWSVAKFSPDAWANGAQITGGVSTTLVAVTGTVVFLVRKGHRVRELRWLIRSEVQSLRGTARASRYFTSEGGSVTAESVVTLVRDPGTMESLASAPYGHAGRSLNVRTSWPTIQDRRPHSP